MRALVGLVSVLAIAFAQVACLRATEFHCTTSAECDPNGTCQPSGYCSVPDGRCPSGSRYTDTAGNEANQCVGGGGAGGDAGVDSPDDVESGCPAGYGALPNVPGDHRYLRVANERQWDDHRTGCATSPNTYLAIPDDAVELAAITTLGGRVWLGLTDEAMEGTFVTVKASPATFLPWEGSAPGGDARDDCVEGIPTTQINDERCDRDRPAVCECAPQ